MDRPRISIPVLLLFAACAQRPLVADHTTGITVVDAQRQSLLGRHVRWGGDIAMVRPGTDDTCFGVISRPLTAAGEPRPQAPAQGRFVTCAPGFYDPSLYARRRTLTVVGALEAPVHSTIGDTPSLYPRVAAQELYFWPERDTVAQNRDWPEFRHPWSSTSGYWW